MKKRDNYETFQAQVFQEIDDLQSARDGAVIKQFRESHGLSKEDTLALWNLDVNGHEFLTSDGAHKQNSDIEEVTAIALVCSPGMQMAKAAKDAIAPKK